MLNAIIYHFCATHVYSYMFNIYIFFHSIGQVITAGLDKKIKFWDIRSTEAVKCLNNISVEVDSLSLSGLTLMVAAGPSVYMYDLRKFDRSILKTLVLNLFFSTSVKCRRSNPMDQILISTPVNK